MQLPPPIHGVSMVSNIIKESELINSNFDCKFINSTTAANLDDIGKGNLKKLKRTYKVYSALVKTMMSYKPSVLIYTPNTTGWSFYRDIITTLIIKFFKSKNTQLVAYFHNKGVKTRQTHFLDNLLYRFLFNNLKVIQLSECLYEDISKYAKKENVLFCPNGLDVDTEDTAIKTDKEDIPQVLWLSNIMKTKGIEEFLDALKLLKDKGVKFRSLIVGASTMEMSGMDLRRMIYEKELEGIVNYVGKKYGEEKKKAFSSSDIFVLPSYTEAFPLTVIEAMAFGLPVIASNVGAVSEEITENETGLFLGGTTPILLNTFRPDVKEFADKLQMLIENKSLRQAMGAKAKVRYKEKFTQKQFENNFKDVLEELLDKAKR